MNKLGILKSKFFINLYLIIISGFLLLFVLTNYHVERYSWGDRLKIILSCLLFLFFIIQSIKMTDKLRYMFSLKYKIFYEYRFQKYRVKYLTSFFLIIPFWKKMEVDYHFTGLIIPMLVSHEIKYDSLEQVEESIIEHKEKLKKNIRKYLKPIEKKQKVIKTIR